MTLFPKVVDAAAGARGRRHPGVRRRHHPGRRHPHAQEAGIEEIFTPGANTGDIVEWLRERLDDPQPASQRLDDPRRRELHGPVRAPGQGAVPRPRHRDPAGHRGRDGRGGGRRDPRARRRERREGAGADRRAGQGRRRRARRLARAAAEEAARMLRRRSSRGIGSRRCSSRSCCRSRAEFYTSILLDRPTGDVPRDDDRRGRHGHRGARAHAPEAIRRVHVDAMLGLRAFHVRELVGTLPRRRARGRRRHAPEHVRDADERDATLVEVNPLVQLDDGSVVALDAKVTVDDNALFRHPEVEAFAARVPDRPGAGAREREGPAVREARRRRRHHRQRRRAGDVDARRRGAGGGRTRELPRRGRRGERRSDGDLARGGAVRPGGAGRARQHLRRHHPVRPGGRGHPRGARTRRRAGADRRASRRHERRGGPAHPGRGGAPAHRRAATMLEAAERAAALAKRGAAA